MISKDAFIYALQEVENAILAALPEPEECSFHFSDRFEQRMRSVIRRGNHPGIYKTLQRVACVLLVLLILFSSVMIFSTDARAAVIGWIKAQYETFYYYFFPAKAATTEQSEYTLGWIPDGYSLANSYSSSSMKMQIYVHPSGNMIYFSYLYGTENRTNYIEFEDYICYEVTINESIAEVFITNSPDKVNGIIWEDETANVFFNISAPLQESELIRLAEGIIKIE